MDFKKYVEEIKLAKEIEEETSDFVKFSINVDDNVNRRLKYVAGELEITRAELTRDLIERSLYQLETALELDPLDFDKPYANTLYAHLDYVTVSGIKLAKEDFIQAIKASREREAKKKRVEN
ncbi:hypothetical protein [Planococcus sp. NCCP-2050]|uniref:hypothetical protein n=1 Tax=Planococcus sp. NCCP-2050 TaxID=2944679 RepID=UPI002040711B|nr:hypothetical protein [Planococcus sp. NCCP-2050]GKW46901.1 hypothetical protein NCCP2050_25930 [Planococcus sp. NCCP-2050]